ncbi:hypothetical protein K227x_64360 [Rubripirellula lacrimiformis]|uniref:Uncharacterized protein n=2 Tax=Rubripirellula lacrimiformis TaxID=1930273 RepID=A0A517NLJ5_9BACT|nr:hypothetical protein K227x_64360 [Rubripirellula lacrimiformis]
MANGTDLVEKLEDTVLAAIEATGAGDTKTALSKLLEAQMLLSVIPDGIVEKEQFTFDRESIERAIVNIRRRDNEASSGIVQVLSRPCRG